MALLTLLITLLTSLLTQALAQTVAKSYTGWDCCKPICASPNARSSRGVTRVCDRSNKPLSLQPGIAALSSCAPPLPPLPFLPPPPQLNPNNAAYLCDTYQPTPVSNDLAYGFAVQVSDTQTPENSNCCKCYQVQWLTGGAANKTMIVQVVTPGGSGGEVKKNDLIILVPGGGLGPWSNGCPNQYGTSYNWGNNQGGVKNREACEKLPKNLWSGCYWRWNWARGELNGWDIVYKPVECPSRLTDISGCKA
ncbi:RlpA-like double-psi beta-barrel-protein domain-containing protein-containing protein [Podospora fimiseda]|uniref:cellulase n=1 Tax=Podospora fimiseda TaxID=252190 RepID=A0AAN7H6W5_9PEZI|nr:RlpA-like double-psi beta-barrel-protein domain-containing protein-containing protein [Podospora fimiseda]